MTRKETIQFGAIIHGVGGTTDGWRHPDINPAASTDLDFYKARAKLPNKGYLVLYLLQTAFLFPKNRFRIFLIVLNQLRFYRH